jgi:hypothetical protein
MPDCRSGFVGSVTIEVGAKAGLLLTANPYANVTFATDDPIDFDYGARAGIELYVGAELYIEAIGRAGGKVVIQ